MNGAAKARKEASPAPMRDRAAMRTPKFGEAAHATTEAVQMARPTPMRRIAL